MTLDQAQDAFRDRPSTKTAKDYTEALKEYFDDGMIGPDTVNAALEEMTQFFLQEAERIEEQVKDLGQRIKRRRLN